MKVNKSIKALKVADFKVGQEVIKRGKIQNLVTKQSAEYGEKYFMTVRTEDKVQAIFVNQTSMDSLIDAWGDNTDEWIGEKISVVVDKTEKGQPMFLVKPIRED